MECDALAILHEQSTVRFRFMQNKTMLLLNSCIIPNDVGSLKKNEAQRRARERIEIRRQFFMSRAPYASDLSKRS